jgi:hypothetical protein
MSKSSDLLNKTWTLSGSKENLNEEQFEDHNYSKKSSTKLSSNNSSPFYKNGEFNRIELSLKSSPTSINISTREDAGYEYRSLNIDYNRNQYEIERIFHRISNMEFTSLFDENTSGLEFE